MSHKVEVQHPFSLGLWIAFGFFVFPFIVAGLILAAIFGPILLVVILEALPPWFMFFVGGWLLLAFLLVILLSLRQNRLRRERHILEILRNAERR